MHNRLKVRTSAEMQAINKKKEEEKAQIYSTLMNKLFEKKESECSDLLMSLSADVIHMNPDVSTVWNIRKECILKFANDDNVERRKSILFDELKLTEAGLRINPKSYCSWYHRCWVLNNFGNEEDWTKELHVCTKYLEMDERNFHCWDYRKYIVERLKTQIEKELDFSLQKLSANFSNYSAWHYRSKLIPRIHSVFERSKLFESNVYQQEISLVENAVYTDPNDQSAWFYHRWLLSHITNCIKFIQAGFDRDSSLAWVVIYPFSSHVVVRGFGNGPWRFLNGNKSFNVLTKHVQKVEKFSEQITLFHENNEEIDSITVTDGIPVFRDFNLRPILTKEEKNCLQQQLISYQQLHKMEAQSKWPLLANVVLREKLGELVEESTLKELCVVDKYRENYYTDLASRHKMENLLSKVSDFSSSFIGSSSGLTALYYNFCFTLFKEVDLSENPLGNHIIRKLDTFLCCEILKLSRCAITSIEEFPTLFNLKVLDLSHNNLTFNTVPNGLSRCSKLQVLNLLNTFVEVDFHKNITFVFPILQIIS